jgi:hypothetical protein
MFIAAKKWEPLKCPSWMNGQTKYAMFWWGSGHATPKCSTVDILNWGNLKNELCRKDFQTFL